MTGKYLAHITHRGREVCEPQTIFVKPEGVRIQSIPDNLYPVPANGLTLQLPELQDSRGIKIGFRPEDLVCEVLDKQGKPYSFGSAQQTSEGVSIDLKPDQPNDYKCQIYIFGERVLLNPLRFTCSPEVFY